MSLLTLAQLLGGFVVLILGAEWLVRGASRLAMAVGISPLVVGLTVVAFGTSSPELGVSVMSAWSGQSGIALGNVVGSNICNVLLILGLSALAAPLLVSRQLIRIEVPLMVGISLLTWLLAADGRIGRLDGALLFAGIVVYTVWAIRRSRRENRQGDEEFAAELPAPAGDAKAGGLLRQLAWILAGLTLLGCGAHWLVGAAISLATALGVSDLLIGLTIVAVGTSLPELATSVMASIRGHRDIAVGNVVGSNIFNLLSVLGLTALVAPEGIPVAETALGFDLPVMVATAVACLPIFFTGHLIARWEGALFFGYYIAYTLYLVLATLQNSYLPAFRDAMAGFVLPLTAVTLAVMVVRTVASRRRGG
ncbi:sodium:calcium antiporter [Desulfuromonas versatilis]|uniref:Sodium:calcium antiporter n=1 Tax=Desulfuromonas versatilis TaxID=2802975 RepID=A0ABM8HYG0_9BACT|nr:calcium/sodium antiporter [Desulfuromonas versatilis]BCR07020.1 sodium:calcium antiporter [Desulfuromonas versatilis]